MERRYINSEYVQNRYQEKSNEYGRARQRVNPFDLHVAFTSLFPVIAISWRTSISIWEVTASCPVFMYP